MDWFDHYLDGLSEGTNVVYPPDTNTWRPVKPTKQQQAVIQDSIVADMVRMRVIQEERVKMEDHGGNFYDGAVPANTLTSTVTTPTQTSTNTPTQTPTPTQTSTNTPTQTPTPTRTLPSYLLLFEDGSFATAENNDNIEINII